MPRSLFPGTIRLAALFFVAAIAMIGMPPLSGFFGKLFILDANRVSPTWPWSWTFVLGTSLVVILGFARAGSTLFWEGGPASETPRPVPERAVTLRLTVCACLLGATALFTALAGPITRELDATARQVFEPQSYVRGRPPIERTDRVLREMTMAARLVPHPLLTLVIAAVWVALVNQPSLAHLLLGLILGLFIPWFTRAYWPDRPIVKRPVRVLEYAAVVLWDIIVSNVQVAYLVLFRRGESLHSQFVSVPLDLLTPA